MGSFQVLAITSSAAINIIVHVFGCTHISNYMGYVCKRGAAASSTHKLTISTCCQAVFPSGGTIVPSHQQYPPSSLTVQFSSVAQSCLTLCDPMDCSMPGLPVHHQLLEFTQTEVHQVGDPTISSSVIPFSSRNQSFPASGSFPMNQFFTSGGQSIV